MEEQLVVLVDPIRDKYQRLLEAHERLQKLNASLEEKLLKLAETHHLESQRQQFQIQDVTQRLVDARLYIHQLEDENERYRNDISVVVQLLHCKPSNFLPPRLDALPDELQRRVVAQQKGTRWKEKKTIKVQVPTFPPTDIIYPLDKQKGKKNSEKEVVSAAIMAKVLQEREKENRRGRCKCQGYISLPTCCTGTQTLPVCTISYDGFNFEELLRPRLEDMDENDETDTEDVVTNNHTSSKITSIDDIMKQDEREEELLPTPIFIPRSRSKATEDSGCSSNTSNQEQLTPGSLSPISNNFQVSELESNNDTETTQTHHHHNQSSSVLHHYSSFTEEHFPVEVDKSCKSPPLPLALSRESMLLRSKSDDLSIEPRSKGHAGGWPDATFLLSKSSTLSHMEKDNESLGGDKTASFNLVPPPYRRADEERLWQGCEQGSSETGNGGVCSPEDSQHCFRDYLDNDERYLTRTDTDSSSVDDCKSTCPESERKIPTQQQSSGINNGSSDQGGDYSHPHHQRLLSNQNQGRSVMFPQQLRPSLVRTDTESSTEDWKGGLSANPVADSPQGTERIVRRHNMMLVNSTRMRVRAQRPTSLAPRWSSTVLVHQPPRAHGVEGTVRRDPAVSPTYDSLDFRDGATVTAAAFDLSAQQAAVAPSSSSQQQQQFYRAQKRTFWARSSSTTSTETEI